MVRYGLYRVDMFTPSIASRGRPSARAGKSRSKASEPTSLRRSSRGVQAAVLPPKDIVDLERLLEVQGDALDSAYVRRELAAMMGDNDERVLRWDALVADRQSVKTAPVGRPSASMRAARCWRRPWRGCRLIHVQVVEYAMSATTCLKVATRRRVALDGRTVGQ